MRFHLIDRIDRVEKFTSITARKLTSRREDFWVDNGRGCEMPPTLVLEALCQAGTWLVMESTDFNLRAALLSIDSVAFHSPVRPGDVLRLEGLVESMGDDTAVLSGRVSVGHRTIMTAEAIMCAMMPAADLEARPSVLRMHRALTRAQVEIAA